MKKVALVFAVAVFLAWSSVAYAAPVGHGGGQVIVAPVTVAEPPQAVLDAIGGVAQIGIGSPQSSITSEQKAQVGMNFGATSKVVVFPTILATVTSGGTAKIAFQVNTTNLLAGLQASSDAEFASTAIIFVLWHADKVGFTEFTYTPSQPVTSSALKAKAGEKTFTFVDANGDPVTKLEAGKEVYPVFSVTDNDPEDTNPASGQIEVAPTAIVKDGELEKPAGDGGGGGCDAGFSGGVLLLSAVGWFLFKKRGA
ncbi:MAG: hypothetical protein LBS00_11730 [Synergistaceae bacterium]|nr:hypothetical protein [Synergistaceae bacterium]